jgi:hypothetical protein
VSQDLVIILETMRIIAIALSPITPSLSLRIYTQLGFTEGQFKGLRWVCSYIREMLYGLVSYFLENVSCLCMCFLSILSLGGYQMGRP